MFTLNPHFAQLLNIHEAADIKAIKNALIVHHNGMVVVDDKRFPTDVRVNRKQAAAVVVVTANGTLIHECRGVQSTMN